MVNSQPEQVSLPSFRTSMAWSTRRISITSGGRGMVPVGLHSAAHLKNGDVCLVESGNLLDPVTRSFDGGRACEGAHKRCIHILIRQAPWKRPLPHCEAGSWPSYVIGAVCREYQLI